jgi:hypothetical protein
MWERIDAGLRSAFNEALRGRLPEVTRQVDAGELLPSVAARRLLAEMLERARPVADCRQRGAG